MKSLIAFLPLLFLTCCAVAQPLPSYVRNMFSTNADPIVDVLAGAGITVTPTVTLPNQRHFTVALTGGGGITAADGTNIAITVSKAATNDLWAYTLILSNNVWLMSTQWVQAQGYATTNQVIDATNSLWGFALILSNNVWLMSTQWVQGQGYATTNQFNLALTNYENRAVTFSNNFLVTSTDHSNSISLNTNGSIMVSNANGILSITPDNLTGTSEFSIKSGLTAQTMLRLNTNGTFIIGTNAISDGSLVNAVIAGGHLNTNLGSGGQGKMSFIGGGASNYLRNTSFSFIGGGWMNRITNSGESVIVGGHTNSINAGNYDFIGSGFGNRIASSIAATIGGGFGNVAIGDYAFVGGGFSNRANATAATIPGGVSNIVIVGADYSFAAGSFANASHAGTFVWSDSTGSPTTGVTSSAPNEVTMRATGGFRLLTGAVKATGPVTSTNGYYVFDSVGTHLDAVLTNGGGTFTAPVLSGSASTSAPASTEFVIRDYVWSNAVTKTNLDFYAPAAAPAAPAANYVRLFGQTVNSIGSLNYELPDGTAYRLARDSVMTVYNAEATTLALGEVVYATSLMFGGTAHFVKRAKADSALTMPAIGIVTDTGGITSSNTGTIMFFGRTAANVNTSVYSASGKTLYVSPTTAGLLTETEPAFPNYRQIMGYVGKLDAATGTITVRNYAAILPDSPALTRAYQLWSSSNSIVKVQSNVFSLRTLDLGNPPAPNSTNLTVFSNAQYFVEFCTPAAGLTLVSGNTLIQCVANLYFNTGGGRALSVIAELYQRQTNGTETEFGASMAPQVLSGSALDYIFSMSLPTNVTLNATDSLLLKLKSTNGSNFNITTTVGAGYLYLPVPASQYVLKTGDTMSGSLAATVFIGSGSSLTNTSGTYESNTCSVTFDLSKPRQYYSTNDNLAFTGLAGMISGMGEREASLTIKNTKAGDITLTIPNPWHTPDGLRVYTITNGQYGELAVKAWGTGVMTNAAVRMLR